MKIGFVNLFISFFFLFFFSYLVFLGDNEIFSIKEKKYLAKINLLENELLKSINAANQTIQETIYLEENRKLIELILKYNFFFSKEKVLFLDIPSLKNVQIYNDKRKVVYYREKFNLSNLAFDKDIFVLDNYLVFNFNYANKREGNLFFFYDLKEFLLKIVKENESFSTLKNLDDILLYKKSYVLDFSSTPTSKNKIINQIDTFFNKGLIYNKVFSSVEEKYLLLKKENVLGINLGTIYSSNKTDIPFISLIIFLAILTIFVFSLITILANLKLSIFLKENNQGTVSSLKDKVIFYLEKILIFKKKPKKNIPVNQEIIGLVEDINNKPSSLNSEELLNMVKEKLNKNKKFLPKFNDEELIDFLNNLFEKQFKKIALLLLFKDKVFLIKEYQNFNEETLNRFALNKDSFICSDFLSKNKIILLKKSNPETEKYLKEKFSEQDLKEISYVIIAPIKQKIKQKNTLRYNILLAV